MSDTDTPTVCPFCGGGVTGIVTNMVEWSAASLEPCDNGNVATLVEHQCMTCEGRSFWTGADGDPPPKQEPAAELSDPQTLEAFAKSIETLRAEILFDAGTEGCDPFSEQHVILALNALDNARSYLKLAALYQARANAHAQGVRR